MICSAYPSLGYYHFAPATLWNASDNTASRSDFAKKVGFSYLLGAKTTCSRILGAHHHRRPRKSESLSVHPTAGTAFTYTYFGVRVFLISHQIKPDDLVCIHHDVRWWNRASASPHCGQPPHPQRGVCGVPRHPANTIPHRRSLIWYRPHTYAI